MARLGAALAFGLVYLCAYICACVCMRMCLRVCLDCCFAKVFFVKVGEGSIPSMCVRVGGGAGSLQGAK